MSDAPLLRVDDLAMYFPVTAGVFGRVVAQVKAVDGVSFTLRSGRTLGLVGESGCGKTTVGQSIVRLLEPTGGRIEFEGRDITHAPQTALRGLRREFQIIFQDPFGSLNPRMTVADIVGESLEVHGIARGPEVDRRVVEVLARVGVPAAWINRYPHEFSGGQRQRISIARAIALEPKLVICDEAVSALDVSIQAQVINLLIDLQRSMQLAYLFISHDLSVVRHISDDVAVMYLGEIVESAPADELFAHPAHPYTRSLLSAIPLPDPIRRSRRTVLEGDVPSPLAPPSGCRFHPRCPAVMDRCRSESPPSLAVGGGHRVGCWHADGLARESDWYVRLERRIDDATAARAPSGPGAAAPLASRLALAAERERAAAPPAAAAPPRARRPVLPRLAVGALLLGALGVLSGQLAVGGIVGGAALALWRRTESGARAPASRSWGAVAALVACAVVSRAIGAAERDREASHQLVGLQQALAEVSAIHGAPPARLADLGWRLPALFADARAELIDPWGSAWRYRTPGADGDGYDLGSLGPDGVLGGGDDVGDPFEP